MSLFGREIPAGYVPGFVCSLDTCDVSVWGFVKYQPSKPGNILFLVLIFAIAFAQIWLGIKFRTASVCLCMLAGLAMESTGYIGRLLLHDNPFFRTYFLMYLVCLTIGPVFFAAAIYLCLGRIVVIYGQDISWLKPKTYTFFFVGCDILSLVIQAAGGIIASIAPLENQNEIDLGTHILVAGLAVQVASLSAFGVVCTEFALRVYKNRKNLNPVHADIYNSRKFKIFLGALVLATICIFTRSVFRVAELSSGFTGRLANNEVSLMVLDGVMVLIACISLSVMHPGIGFSRAGWAAATYPFFKRKDVGETEAGQVVAETSSGEDGSGDRKSEEKVPQVSDVSLHESKAVS